MGENFKILNRHMVDFASFDENMKFWKVLEETVERFGAEIVERTLQTGLEKKDSKLHLQVHIYCQQNFWWHLYSDILTYKFVLSFIHFNIKNKKICAEPLNFLCALWYLWQFK